MNVLEFLPNEILLNVFEFLNNFHLLHGFCNLNYRFNQLIYNHFQFHPLDFRRIPKHHFDIICKRYLPSIIHRITSFYLSDGYKTPNQPKLFVSYGFKFNQFSILRSLTLDSFCQWELLIQITFQCRNLQYLTHLNIINKHSKYSSMCVIDSLINNIWNLPKLTHCNLDFLGRKMYSLEKFSVVSLSIKYLFLNESFDDLDALFDLFKHTPYLKQLTTNYLQPMYTKIVSSTVMASSIRTFECGYVQDKGSLIMLFQNMPNLNKLIVDIYENYWDGYVWENILTNYIPNIKIFHFKMNFTFAAHIDKETQVNKLLDSFRTSFWLDKHQWYVRCHWVPFRNNIITISDIIYTLPYTFKTFTYSQEYRIRSTCPNEADYSIYNSVQTIFPGEVSKYCNRHILPFRLPNLHRCSTRQLLYDEFWIYNSSLDKLTALVIEYSPEQTSYHQLHALVDKIPNLSSLIFVGSITKSITLLNLTNTSIHILDFRNATASASKYFDHTDCIALANSSLGRQCRHLSIRVQNRLDVLYLARQMPNLQSLVFQCEEDPMRYMHTRNNSINNDVHQWLHDNLPLTYSITKYTNNPELFFRLWISDEIPKGKIRIYLNNFFRRWRSSTKYLFCRRT